MLRESAGILSLLLLAALASAQTISHAQLAGERPNYTLNTTGIVDEAYIRMAGRNEGWRSLITRMERE